MLTAHPTEAQRRSALKKHEQMLQQMKVWDVGRAPAVAGGEYKVEYAVKRDCWEWQLLLDLNYSMIYIFINYYVNLSDSVTIVYCECTHTYTALLMTKVREDDPDIPKCNLLMWIEIVTPLEFE